MSDKTATERLRELLDELRKQACDINEEEIRLHSVITLNQGRYNRQFRLDMNHEWLDAWHAEHERTLQAIAATLGDIDATATRQGVGTCHLINAADDLGAGTSSFMCFECGYTALDEWWDEFNYCPNCGAKVVAE